MCLAVCRTAIKDRTPLRAHSKATDCVTSIARRLCIGVYLTRLRWTQAAIRVTAQQRKPSVHRSIRLTEPPRVQRFAASAAFPITQSLILSIAAFWPL